MEQLNPQMVDAAQGLWGSIVTFFQLLLLPSRRYQLVAVVVLAGLSWLLSRWLSRLLTDWLRRRENWPKWRLRLGLLVNRRLALLVFVVLSWVVVLVMREITWPSRSQVIALAATIATAWAVIFFMARIIANRFLRRIVTWAAWIWVTLELTQLTGSVANLLDGASISFGDFRLSALTVIKALAVTGLMIAGVPRVVRRWRATSIGPPTSRAQMMTSSAPG